MSERTTEAPEPATDPEIAAFVDQLHQDSQNGLLACVAIVSVRNDGSAARFLHGAASSVVLLGELEFLKAIVIHDEFQAAEKRADEQPAYLC